MNIMISPCACWGIMIAAAPRLQAGWGDIQAVTVRRLPVPASSLATESVANTARITETLAITVQFRPGLGLAAVAATVTVTASVVNRDRDCQLTPGDWPARIQIRVMIMALRLRPLRLARSSSCCRFPCHAHRARRPEQPTGPGRGPGVGT